MPTPIPRPDVAFLTGGEPLRLSALHPAGRVPDTWIRDASRRTAEWGLAGPGGVLLRLEEVPRLGPEAYELEVASDRVSVRAADRGGVAHGLSVLSQLLPARAHSSAGCEGEVAIELVRMSGRPRYAYRGAMIDLSRHFMGKQVIVDLVCALTTYGYNRVHLHLTDDQGWRIESRIHPELTETGAWRSGTRLGPGGVYDPTPHGGFLSLADLRELADLARGRGAEIVAEIDLPGHSSALLASMPQLGRDPRAGVTETVAWGGGSLRPVPSTRDTLIEILDELVDETGIRLVHLGGDECEMGWWKDDPDTARHARSIGAVRPEDLHAWLLTELAQHLEKRGVTPLAWDEAFVTGGVTDNEIVTAWRGDGVAERAAQEHSLVRAPLYPCYFNFDQSTDPEEPRAQGGPLTLDDVMGFDIAPETWSDVARSHVIGGEFAVWTEWITTPAELEYMIFPRALAMAEVLWHGGVQDRAGMLSRIESALPGLEARGISYRPLDGPRPWQRGGLGRRRRATGNDMASTREWLESVSHGA